MAGNVLVHGSESRYSFGAGAKDAQGLYQFTECLIQIATAKGRRQRAKGKGQKPEGRGFIVVRD